MSMCIESNASFQEIGTNLSLKPSFDQQIHAENNKGLRQMQLFLRVHSEIRAVERQLDDYRKPIPNKSKRSCIYICNSHLLYAYYAHDTFKSAGEPPSLAEQTHKNQDYVTRVSYRKLQSTGECPKLAGVPPLDQITWRIKGSLYK